MTRAARPAHRRRAPRRRAEVIVEPDRAGRRARPAARARGPAHRLAALAHRVGDAPTGAAHGARPRRAPTWAGAIALAACRPCAWRSRRRRPPPRPADEPCHVRSTHHRRASLRSRRTAPATSPWPAPAALIIGHRQRGPRQLAGAGRGVADRLGRPEDAVEALEVAGGPSAIARRPRRPTSAAPRATGSSRPAARRPRSAATRSVSSTRTRIDDEGGEGEHAQHDGDDQRQLTSGHPPSPAPSLVSRRRALMRRATSSSCPWPLGRYQWRSDSSSGRYCWSTQAPIRRGRAHEGTRSRPVAERPWRPGSGYRAGAPAPRRARRAAMSDRAFQIASARCGCSSAPSPGGSPPGPG